MIPAENNPEKLERIIRKRARKEERERMRTAALTSKWASGRFHCPFCGQPLWFTSFENIPEFLERIGITEGRIDPREYVATVDHVVPISRGGPGAIRGNLRVCCRRCNMSKDDATMSEWIAELQMAGHNADGRVWKEAVRQEKAVLRWLERRGVTIRERANYGRGQATFKPYRGPGAPGG
jgi:hypothetical protein